MKEVLTVIAVAEMIGVTISIFNTIMTLHYAKKAERREHDALTVIDTLYQSCTNLEARIHKLEEKDKE